jgi:cell division protein FtsI (penicillin-binding protein 3)
MKDQQPQAATARHLLIALFFVAWMGAIVWRLADVQVTRRAQFIASAESQHRRTGALEPLRGTIVDRHGQELAATVDPDSVVADLYKIKFKDAERERAEKTRIADLLAPLLGEDKGAILDKLNGHRKLPVLKARVDAETAQKVVEAVERHRLPGVQLVKAPQRYYPNGVLAAHSVGFVNAESAGVAGLEMRRNADLIGKAGRRDEEVNAQGKAYLRRDLPPTDGARVETTLDLALQHKVEAALAVALQETRARSVSAVVLDPKTGEILALANAPTFDPNARMKGDEGFARRNRAVSDTYEPGSVFKLVTYAAAIEEGLATPDEKIDCRSITIGSRVRNDDHPGVYTVAEALAKSSNVGAMRLAQRLVNAHGRERLAEYITRFGFGSRTGVDLPAEASGRLRPVKEWQDVSLASIPIGYEVTITPLQAAAAMAAIANGGVWVQPHVIRRVVSPDGTVREEAAPKTRRVVSEQTARVVAGMLEEVVTGGTGRRALQFGGYRAAGKTGTAYKAEGGRYSKTKFVATFAGFVPLEQPRFAIVVTIDEPQGLHQGGQVAAPVFSHIAEAALGDYGVLPETEDHRQAIARLGELYRVKQGERRQESADATRAGTPADASERERAGKQNSARRDAVANALPASEKARRNEVAVAVTPAPRAPQPRGAGPQKGGADVMPDLHGRGLRDVVSAASRLQLKLKISGGGLAVRQSLAPGSRVRPGEVCAVEFR